MATQQESIAISDNAYAQLSAYDWAGDEQFQGGLQSILGSATSPEQIEQLTIQARCFYFSRKFGMTINVDDYQTWLAQRHAATKVAAEGHASLSNDTGGSSQQDAATETPVGSSSTSPMGGAPTPASFAEICQLIAEGKPIPGIKDIPDTVLAGQASASTAQKRRKPWERQNGTPYDSTAAV